MVPLDGSALAECVLPHVEAITKGCATKDLVLLRIVEPERVYTVSNSPIDPESRFGSRVRAKNVC